ncbi:hypothetical protein PHYBLDRAFT_174490 [Phycomyces blakesleeanus NRRL 1555(-)]|uniref:Uncharacterized protein n=1 Tax=Phycomyces blakesleeanus (strain ATCC 8743b / DSM 1359 / FGSC 10004 / NBRC 33097 / NRRL 1555) TaxID=763407 RepID=A0A162N9I6_PHYB8|nr:hypothetical protein PHYBLDRAFT_174490 [Phycomyces blakesleeanus NRRL 1555(-)]OAD67104.1 hypothetical protein PHYBLDRAFT_174490 [Phycomyces blakesleeanus NRRL 1555(-)]|eukprot:XP_018285144.1 hypothetical protein PHYBLDRAFT_174490 [Phycomyces blakesleeanus NRRL 1555(-)]
MISSLQSDLWSFNDILGNTKMSVKEKVISSYYEKLRARFSSISAVELYQHHFTLCILHAFNRIVNYTQKNYITIIIFLSKIIGKCIKTFGINLLKKANTVNKYSKQFMVIFFKNNMNNLLIYVIYTPQLSEEQTSQPNTDSFLLMNLAIEGNEICGISECIYCLTSVGVTIMTSSHKSALGLPTKLAPYRSDTVYPAMIATTLSQYEYVLICDKSNIRVSGSPQNYLILHCSKW